MSTLRTVFTFFLLFVPALSLASAQESSVTETYVASFESLAKHTAAPEWFRDAKLGIYFHWGVYSVPAHQSEWYPRWMHFPGHGVRKHHEKTHGPLDQFGYHDFVPQFKAEKFDAAQWAELFQQAGAKFAGPVAEHHDGFAMWDSTATPWNAVDMGPQRDITGELEKEIRARGMKFIATFHHARNLQRYANKPGEKDRKDKKSGDRWFDSHFPYVEGTPPTSEDPLLRQLYGNMPESVWLEMMWLAKLKEVIDQYEPDMIWFDAWLRAIPQEYQEKFTAYYLNRAKQQGREVMIVRKNDDLPLEYSVNDFEKGRMATLAKEPWLTDDTISKVSWCYTRGMEIKSLPNVLHVFIDIVSKNGCLLLNLSPKADGTIPDDQREVLLGLGKWLDQNGEAIYGTRPFITYGEGPTHIEKGGHFLKQTNYTPQDIRYTRKGKMIYAIQLGMPKPGDEVVLRTFGKVSLAMDLLKRIDRVTLLGSEAEPKWTTGNSRLIITVPEELSNEVALVWRISLQ